MIRKLVYKRFGSKASVPYILIFLFSNDEIMELLVENLGLKSLRTPGQVVQVVGEKCAFDRADGYA
jgi:hypothetical protein